jgi:hypothetical protein
MSPALSIRLLGVVSTRVAGTPKKSAELRSQYFVIQETNTSLHVTLLTGLVSNPYNESNPTAALQFAICNLKSEIKTLSIYFSEFRNPHSTLRIQ